MILIDYLAWDPTASELPVELIHSEFPGSERLNRVSKRTWKDCSKVLESLHMAKTYELCGVWMMWSRGVLPLLQKTRRYADTGNTLDEEMQYKWEALIAICHTKWAGMVHSQDVVAETEDDIVSDLDSAY